MNAAAAIEANIILTIIRSGDVATGIDALSSAKQPVLKMIARKMNISLPSRNPSADVLRSAIKAAVAA